MTFTADHAAKKESMLSDVQVSGVKASEAQEGLVVARWRRVGGAAVENEKSENPQIASIAWNRMLENGGRFFFYENRVKGLSKTVEQI